MIIRVRKVRNLRKVRIIMQHDIINIKLWIKIMVSTKKINFYGYRSSIFSRITLTAIFNGKKYLHSLCRRNLAYDLFCVVLNTQTPRVKYDDHPLIISVMVRLNQRYVALFWKPKNKEPPLNP